MPASTRSMKFFLLLAFIALIFMGCAGPLEINYEPRTKGQFTIKTPAAVHVAPFEDKRQLTDEERKEPRTIGKIEATVSDITGDRLTLSEDVAEVVERAYGKELALAGFTVVPEKEKAGYIVSGEVREFRLDVASRDAVAIEVASILKDAKTGLILWSGIEAERGEKFAGVMGNSRATLSNHIAASLQKMIRRSISSAAESFSSGTVEAPKTTAPLPSAGGSGTAVITASPERSKVYIDGVYYGFSPMTIDLPAGVYEVTITQKGFKPFTERVSIRKDAKTEVEAELEKE